MFRISIQDSIVKAFEDSELIGETTVEKLQDYCKANNIAMPNVWNENDTQTIEIVKQFFS